MLSEAKHLDRRTHLPFVAAVIAVLVAVALPFVLRALGLDF